MSIRAVQLILFALLYTSVFAQTNIPRLGKIEKSDLLLTECPYDKDAVAFKLIDWGSVYYENSSGESSFKTVYKKRQRIKIFGEKGLKYANISIPFYSRENLENIVKIEAYTYNLKNNIVEVSITKKSATYIKQIDKSYSELIIPLVNVRVGSVIEYQYTLESQSVGHLKDWYFQDDIPTKYSECELKIPLIYTFNIQPSIIDSLTTIEKVTEDIINANHGLSRINTLHKRFIMQNLKSLPIEPYMGATKDYQQRLQFQLAQINYGKGQVKYLNKDWEDIVNILADDEDFGKQLQSNFKPSYTFTAELQSKTNDEQKLAFMLHYFQNNFVWNYKESVYCYKGIKETWNKKSGSTGDINLLFIKILKDAGLTVFPILFSTRDNGTVNTFFPFIEQFNTTLCYVTIGDKNFIVDASDKFSNYSLIPEKIVQGYGFVVNDSIGKWVNTKDISEKYKTTIAIKGVIDEYGVMSGDANVISNGYATYNRIKKWHSNKDEFINTYFSNNNQSIQLNDLQTKSNEYNSIFEQKANFTYKLGTTGNYQYFITNIYTELNKNPFIKDDRSTDIDFGYTQEYQLYGNFVIPYSYKFEDLPRNMSFSMPDNSIMLSRFVDANDNNLNIRFTIEFKKPYYTVSVYPEFKEFYKKMFDFLNEQIVIKKK